MRLDLPESLSGRMVYMVGIKGTGMAAFAELLLAQGARVTGSDVPDRFFTDEILEALRIPFHAGFGEDNLQGPIDLVIHSAAYSPETHPELLKAKRLGLPILVYTEALGLFSRRFYSAGVAGVHGKTTTTAMCGVISRAFELPFSVLVGSVVPDFGERATLQRGGEIFIAETCEYKRHFLDFMPQVILVTSIELDHTDYFKDEADIFAAFREYTENLPEGGTVIFCADDAGAARLAQVLASERPDLQLGGYGTQAEGRFRIVKQWRQPGQNLFQLDGFFAEFALTVPGDHNVLNAAGALALCIHLLEKRGRTVDSTVLQAAVHALNGFRGSRRRSQKVGEARGVLVMDDYGHHPTAIATTLRGLKDFHPDRRLVVDFMSHTYSRTKSLLTEFASSFEAADEVILHKIYASARETADPKVSGRTLFEETCRFHKNVKYFEELNEAVPYLLSSLKSGDLLVTMGAGDNWKVGLAWLEAAKGTTP